MEADFLLYIPPILLAIIIHEVAHGYAAFKLGDNTASMLGRLTLNPLPHIDPVGSVIFPILQMVVGGRVFLAWAKPVPINLRNLKNPLRDYAIIAIAGPASNLVQAALWSIPFWVLELTNDGGLKDAVFNMSIVGVQINLALMTFNMLPLPPLDGSRVVAAFLPPPVAMRYLSFEKYTFFILIGVLIAFPNVLGRIIMPVIHIFQSILLPG